MLRKPGFRDQDSGFRIRQSRFVRTLVWIFVCLSFVPPLADHSSLTFAQLPAGTPIYSVNAKWVTDHGSQVYNVMSYGAKCDGVANDTAAIQSVLNLANSARAGGSNLPLRVYIPATATGCNITAPLLLVPGYAPYNAVLVEGEAAGPNTGATLNWAGPAGGTMFEMLGCFGCRISHVNFNQNNSARVGLTLTADNEINTTVTATISPGSQTVTPVSMSSIWPGRLISIDAAPNFEAVYVTAVTSSTFTATFTKAHSGTWQVGGPEALSNVSLEDVYVMNVPNSATDWITSPATATAGLQIGGGDGASGGEADNVKIYNSTFAGQGTASACVAMPQGGNAMTYSFINSEVSGCQYGYDFGQVGGSNIYVQGGSTAGTTVSDFRGGPMNTEIHGVEVESSTPHRFLVTSCSGAPGTYTLTGNVFMFQLPADGYVVEGDCPLVMIGNAWGSMAQTVQAKIATSNYVAAGLPGEVSSVVSIGNTYINAPGPYAPIYAKWGGNTPLSVLPVCSTGATCSDQNGNPLPANYPSKVISINDYGRNGSTGVIANLASWLGGSQLGSSSGPIPTIGLVNAADADCPVVWMNHAGTGNVPFCKNTSDQPTLGGNPITLTIASFQTTVNPGAIASGACSSAIQLANSNIVTTGPPYQHAEAVFVGDPTGTTGYAPSTSGNVYIVKYLTAGNLNLKICNGTASSITPGSVTINAAVTQ